MVPGFRSLCIMPLACKHSIAWAMSRANLMATWSSNGSGRILIRYFRSDIPGNSSVTITIRGSLQAPINCRDRKRILHPVQQLKQERIQKELVRTCWITALTLTRFSCFTRVIMLTSRAKRFSSAALSSDVLPRLRTLTATIWLPYLENNYTTNYS
jgi:hypothetical protein